MRRLSGVRVIDPLEFYSVADYKLYDLLSWLLNDVTTLRKSGMMPSLGFLEDTLEPIGVAATRPHTESPLTEDNWVLIHWPTVLEKIDTAFDLGQYSTVAILWHFREVLFRRSVVFHDLLQRKIAQHLTYRYFPLTESEKEKRGYVDLSDPEEEVFKSLRTSVISTPRTMDALRWSFRHTLLPRGTNDKIVYKLLPDRRMRTLIFEKLSGAVPSECSIFSATALLKMWRQLECVRVARRVSGSGFGPSTLSPDLKELFYAFHLRRVDLGVARLTANTLAINLSKYVPYRTRLTSYYKNLVGSSDYRDIEKTCGRVRDYFESIFEPLVVHGAAPLYRGRIESLWGDAALEHVLFLSNDGITRRLSQANRMEEVRASKTSQPKTPGGAKTPRLYVMASPPLMDIGYDEMRFEMIRRPRGVFWSVPWEMPFWVNHEPVSARGVRMSSEQPNLPRKGELRRGVTYVEAFDKYFYSLEMLKNLTELPKNPVRESVTLYRWMSHISAMPPKQFRLLQAGLRKDLVAQQQRAPGKSLRGTTWTREEDDAIKLYYRPGMNYADEAVLQGICRGRTQRAIMRRATELRNSMIESGIFDIDLLPHRNYNAKLRKLVQDAKENAYRALYALRQ